MPDSSNDRHCARRAIEALRNGVPNRDAVRSLGCDQPRAEEEFDRLLAAAGSGGEAEGSTGMVVSGDFGEGKSHLLAYLHQRALDERFVCSKVAISKETPLYNLDKVFQSAVANASVPDHNGRLIEELALSAKLDSTSFGEFYGWVANEVRRERLSPMFQATLVAYECSDNLDLKGRIEGFWSGGRLNSSDLKRGLRAVGKREFCAFRAPRLADLPPQRTRFLLELVKGAGYSGWVVLLDEIELIGSYSQLQRGRAYAEFARWFGRAPGHRYPGLVGVGAVTGDFAIAFISSSGRRKDSDYIGSKLSARPRDQHLAQPAEAGMSLLQNDCIPLKVLDEEAERAALVRLRELYSEAYGWTAPDPQRIRHPVGVQNRMRYKVRSAINEWDLTRLDPESAPETVADDFRPRFDGVPDALEVGPAGLADLE